MSANHRSFARSRLAHHLLIRGPVLALGAVVVLLAQVGAGAAPGRSVSAPSSGKTIFQPVGRAQVTTMRTTNYSPPAYAGLVPVRPMNPAALAATKRRADAAAINALPTIPSHAGPGPAARKPLAAIFNNLNQPGLSASDEGNGGTRRETTVALGPTFYMEFVNQFVGVFDRNTLARVAALDLASFVGAPSGLTTQDVESE